MKQERFLRLCPVAACALFLCLWRIAVASCPEPDPLAPPIALRLARAVLAPNGMLVGEFEVENNSVSKSLMIPGRTEKGAFAVDYPAAALEFKALNGLWLPLDNHVPGTFATPPDKLKIPLGTQADFKADLFLSSASYSGTDFRLILHTVDPVSCIVSFPFRAYPERSSVEGIAPLPYPGSGHRPTKATASQK